MVLLCLLPRYSLQPEKCKRWITRVLCEIRQLTGKACRIVFRFHGTIMRGHRIRFHHNWLTHWVAPWNFRSMINFRNRKNSNSNSWSNFSRVHKIFQHFQSIMLGPQPPSVSFSSNPLMRASSTALLACYHLKVLSLGSLKSVSIFLEEVLRGLEF